MTELEQLEMQGTDPADYLADQISRLNGYQIASLSGHQIARLNGDQIASLNGYQIARLSGDQIARLNGYQIARLSGDQIASLSGDQIASLNGDQIASLNGDQIARLSGDQIARLNGYQIARLSGDQIARLNGYQIARLSGHQIARLSGDQIASLSGDQIAPIQKLLDSVPLLLAPYTALQLATENCSVNFDMSKWHHSCGTTHCAAGWIVTLAGDAGKVIESRFCTPTAARLILRKSCPTGWPMPNFYASDEAAAAFIKKMAAMESALAVSQQE